MNTTKIGDAFEDRVFDIISTELTEGRFLFEPEGAKIFQKKRYYSPDRQKDIEFDVSIEVYMEGAEEWSMLIVLECKDYSNKIPVDDIEEFKSKLDQVAGKNVKGFIVATNTFQEGALNYAKSNGIGLVRITESDKLKWTLRRNAISFISRHSNSDRESIKKGLISSTYVNEHLDFFSTIGDTFLNNPSDFLETLLKYNEDPEKCRFIDRFKNEKADSNKPIVPFLKKKYIESKSLGLLELSDSENFVTPLLDICEVLNSEKDLEIEFVDTLQSDSTGFEILGKIEFDPDKIYIKKGQENYHRKRFTVAHELGHYFLEHGDYLKSEFYSQKDEQDNYLKTINLKDIKRLEWQANYFASRLMLPREKFLRAFSKVYEKEDITNTSHGILYVDNQSCNLDTFYRITNNLRSQFQVSRKVIEIRLKEEGILVDKRWANDFSINFKS